MGDGIAEATVAINHGYREPPEKRHEPAWFERQRLKIDRGLAVMEKDLGAGEYCCGGRFSLADVATGYALGYLDFALPDIAWRKTHPALARLAERLAARKSFNSTVHSKLA